MGASYSLGGCRFREGNGGGPSLGAFAPSPAGCGGTGGSVSLGGLLGSLLSRGREGSGW